MADLTSTQKKALLFIQSNIENIGSAPTLRELCSHMGYKAIGSAQDLVGALRRKGFLNTPSKQAARSLNLTDKGMTAIGADASSPVSSLFDFGSALLVPCIGAVPAGDPIEAIEEEAEKICVSSSLLQGQRFREEKLFALRAVGESMIGAGIMDGDWLVVNSQEQADTGNIVVARFDGDATVKRLMKDKKRGWFLQPENPEFQPIFGDEDPFQVIGKVVALQRAMMH